MSSDTSKETTIDFGAYGNAHVTELEPVLELVAVTFKEA